MTHHLIITPGSPALVPQLGTGDPAAAGLREAVSAVLADADPDAPIDLVGSRASRWHTGHTGSLKAWGADVTVGDGGAGNYLPELVQRYLLGASAARVRSVRASIDPLDPAAVTLIAVDGSAGLTTRAPLTLLPGAAEVDAWCRSLLAGEEPGASTSELLAVAGVIEPDLWLQLARLRPRRARLLAADTSTGVGRYVAAWEVD